MSADRLREAARVLRERAEAAAPGPWNVETGPTSHYVCDKGGWGVAATVYQSGADFIATMHPGVALALADWLDNMARAVHGTSRGDVPFEGDAHRIADLILGSQP